MKQLRAEASLGYVLSLPLPWLPQLPGGPRLPQEEEQGRTGRQGLQGQVGCHVLDKVDSLQKKVLGFFTLLNPIGSLNIGGTLCLSTSVCE